MLWRYGPGNGDQDWSLPGLASDRVPQQSCQDPALEGDNGTHSQTPRRVLSPWPLKAGNLYLGLLA
jgi:hypothetical protein